MIAFEWLTNTFGPQDLKKRLALRDGGPPPTSSPLDPNALIFDPNALIFDPNALIFDPNVLIFDPNAIIFDPNAFIHGNHTLKFDLSKRVPES